MKITDKRIGELAYLVRNERTYNSADLMGLMTTHGCSAEDAIEMLMVEQCLTGEEGRPYLCSDLACGCGAVRWGKTKKHCPQCGQVSAFYHIDKGPCLICGPPF